MLRVGIIGLPNVGKSTLFNALTKQGAESANFPFTTIEPNIGIVPVPDERLEALSKMSASAKTVPTAIEFVDIAGLVKNAHKGEGLGNQFLSHIRQVDAIAHVVRVFDNPDIQHVDNSVDPKRDVETIQTELELADLAVAEKMKKKGTAEEHAVPKLSEKPVLYVANMSEEQIKTPEKYLPEPGWLTLSIKIEQELVELSDEDKKTFLEEYGLKETGLNRLIQAGYQLLNLATFFTTGEKESRAWTIKKDSLAPEAAGQIHDDMQRGFIRAETINWQDLVSAGSYPNARAQGKVRDEGKEYAVHDGDVMIFKFSV